MRFAVIGSGSIVEKFISAGRLCEDFELYAVCSRTRERADRLRVVRKRHRLHRHFARCEGLRQQRHDPLAAKSQNVFLHRIHSLWHEYSTPRAG